MTVAGKINSLVIAIALIGATLFAAITIQREYSYARSQLIQQTYDRVQSLPALPAALAGAAGARPVAGGVRACALAGRA